MNRARALFARLDVQSRSVLRRFGVLLCFYLFWSALIGARHWATIFVVLTFLGALGEMGIALYNREKVSAASLGRWDLVAAFIGLNCLVRIVA